ncbi:Transcriptional regulator of nonfermentable carbon utilization [Kickxella alabastrina]|uniref:Transcriptional regulator of nonfermentable carbon utilization n=1 Tax=Kickxella alabastrina TaxID=61397 RepID=A0ACC1ICT3_9FUNG|nr:Transcriptional regulator of nonfermentable carbon utilization [Kickxella alabastrina]
MQTMSHMAPFSQSTQSQGLTLAVPALTSGPGATIQDNSDANQSAAYSSKSKKTSNNNNNSNNSKNNSSGITIDTPISNADTIAGGGLPSAVPLGGPANGLRMTPTSASFESEAINLEYAFLSSMLSYPMLANPSGLSTTTENTGFGAGSTISIPNSLWAAPPPPPHQTQLPPLIPSQSHLGQPQNHHNNHQLGSVAHMMHRQESWQNHQPLMHHDNNSNTHAAPANIYPHQHAMSTLAKPSPPPHAQIVADDTHYPLSRPPTTGPAVYGLNPVYPQSPAEVYSSVTEPYKYYNGFHYFFRHICGRMDKKNIIRVSRAIAHFRPSLVALLRNLTHDDLIFMEKSFQRALMEYEKLIGFIGTPTVVWRRSGEIALVGKEFSILTQWDRQQLVSGNKFIFELMDTTSAVVYWEQFAVHAFENSEHAVMSECRLVRPDGVAVPYQWVAVDSESSGVISLTSSDYEDDDEFPESTIPVPTRNNIESEQETADKGKDKDKRTEPSFTQTTGCSSEATPLLASSQRNINREIQWPAQLPLQHSGTTPHRLLSGISTRRVNEKADKESEQAVHLLRESVASLLSSAAGGSSGSSLAASANSSANNSRHVRASLRQTHRQPRSPSSLSKISEPCYPPSAPRRRFAADFDHFSDIALSSNTSPPFLLPRGGNARSHTVTTQFPTYEEYKQQQMQMQHVPLTNAPKEGSINVDSAVIRQPAGTMDTINSSAAGDTSTPGNTQRSVAHPLLDDHIERNPVTVTTAAAATLSISVMASRSRSPFASIRTVTPTIIMADRNSALHMVESRKEVSRAQAESVLEHTILCPMKLLRESSGYYDGLLANPDDSATDASTAAAAGCRQDDESSFLAAKGGDGSGIGPHISSGWAKYTGYAIVGFGVGTLVGMMYLDMANTAAVATPKATRSFPITSY